MEVGIDCLPPFIFFDGDEDVPSDKIFQLVDLYDKSMVLEKRVEFGDKLTKREIQTLISNHALRVLQCSRPVKNRTWKRLNDQFFPKRPEVQLRVYGCYGQVCDLSFGSMLTNVRHFSADCMMDAQGVEHISAMEKLESLGGRNFSPGRV